MEENEFVVSGILQLVIVFMLLNMMHNFGKEFRKNILVKCIFTFLN